LHAPVHAIEEVRHRPDSFLHVLDEAVAAALRTDEPFAIIGELGSAAFGRDRGTRDIDLFVRPGGAPVVFDALSKAGFDVRVVDDHWLYKGVKRGIDVDLIFRASRDVLLDDEMIERIVWREVLGRSLPVAPPEDLVIMKAMAADEATARYWYDAVGILARAELDWDYLVARARQHGARRILSLLLFAGSVDLIVPTVAIERLYAIIRGEDE
jgi:hypothetical protein